MIATVLREMTMPITRDHQDYRRRAILKLLTERPMTRQIEIGRALRKQGFKVTQSSVSRDLQALGVVRKNGVYSPPLPQGDESSIGKMEQFIRQVRSAGPYMLVFDTLPGTARAVAVALKSAAWPEVRGVVTDDDTLMVATDNVYDSRLLLQRLKRVVKD
jgi:transcriptional regulator of arginine metabolism